MRRGYDRVEGSIGRSYNEIKGVTLSVSKSFHMLSEITTGKNVKKLDCLSIAGSSTWILKSPVMMRGGGCVGKKR